MLCVNGRFVLLLSSMGCLCPGGPYTAMAGAATPSGIVTGTEEELEEVIIIGHQEKLSVLERKIEKTQDRYFEAYNKANTDPEYQYHCSKEVPIGSLIPERVCRPEFVDEAIRDEAEDYMAGRDIGEHASNVIANRMPDFWKHMLAVVNKDPKLVDMALEINALQKHYQEVRKQKFKGHFFVRD
jgi:hypothetical protein